MKAFMNINLHQGLFVAIVLIFACLSQAALKNGSFELIAEPNSVTPFSPPADWQIENYASVTKQFIPNPNQRNESAFNWPEKFFSHGLQPIDGESFLLLSSGDISPDQDRGTAWQEFDALPGQTLQGVFFFGTFDFTPYSDEARIVLRKVSDPNSQVDIVLAGLDVSRSAEAENFDYVVDVGSYGAMGDWQEFRHLFTEETAGRYIIELSVHDMQDYWYRSYLAVDGLRLCQPADEGDLNFDCAVDLFDFAILADQWMCNCSDPNALPDPNDCDWESIDGQTVNVRGDLDGDNVVDSSDLEVLNNNWLSGEKPAP